MARMKRNPTLRSRVLKRDGLKCAECGKDCSKPPKTGWPSTRKNSAAVDHRIPLWVGGKDTLKNARVLCEACHKAKTKREATLRAKSNRTSRKFQKHKDAMTLKFPFPKGQHE